jgi:F-type H+-transporting ATPase subunit epsilon
MKIEIITPESCLYEGEALSVTVPSMQGPFTMLEHHAAIVAVLEAGKITLIDLNNETHEFDINGGFCEQHDDTVIICVES